MEKNRFFNFKSGEDFNLDEEYKTLFNDGVLETLDPNEVKLKDAEAIIQELGTVYIEGLSLQKYEEVFTNLSEFLSRFRVDSDDVKNMSRESRDKLFGYGKELFQFYQNQYSQLYFNFELSKKEWNYIENTLNKKISYNGQELFNYWELYTKFLEPTANIANELPKQLDSFVPIASIQSLILLSHLLMKHEEKGGTESFHHFRTVLTEMAKMTKLFNAYGVMLERVTNVFNNWVNALNVMDEYNDNTTENVLTTNELQQ
jgi:hypothetical protein